MSLYAKKTGCQECGFCKGSVCPIDGGEECIGCGACFIACPYSAVEMVQEKKGKEIEISVDGQTFIVYEQMTVKQALETLGFAITKYPEKENPPYPSFPKGGFAPCEVGGCFSCAVEIDGGLKPGCVTPVREGLEIRTNTSTLIPKRLVHGFSGHTVGGVGTPWYLKRGYGYIEAACFAAGCNFRCPQCQNWTTTYCGKGRPKTPKEAALMMTATRRQTSVDRMAISGGESTLNRRWLVEYIKELKKLNPDKNARFHVDTNGSILTEDYIDELVDAGMTDIGIDLKGMEIETFIRITGVNPVRKFGRNFKPLPNYNEVSSSPSRTGPLSNGVNDRNLASRYKDTAWKAVKYIHDNYSSIFLGIGIPYNKELISLEEIQRMGEKIKAINPEIQVCPPQERMKAF